MDNVLEHYMYTMQNALYNVEFVLHAHIQNVVLQRNIFIHVL
jgi:hypothetical protein